MNSLKMILAACAFVTVSLRAWSAELQTNEVLTVILELVDGSRVIGTPGVEAVAMQTPYAKVSLPLKQILSITMEADHENASFYLKNGDTLTGVMTLGPIPLTTAFGQVTVAVEHIRQLAVATGRILSQPTSEPLRIGKRKDADFNANGNLYFGGSMDDVRIYNRVLTDDEISGICGPRD